MESIDNVKKILKECTSPEERTICGVWETNCFYNPLNNGRIFNYKYIIVQTLYGQGSAYSLTKQYDEQYLISLIGKDCLGIKIQDEALEIACLDSIINKLQYNYVQEIFKYIGSSNEKLSNRSELILSEAERLLGNFTEKKILNVGVVGDIIHKFIKSGCYVVGTDYDESIIGKKMFDEVNIYSGKYTLDILKEVDLAVVTGMTLSTYSLDDIIKVAKEYGVKLIVFAETGANMGQYYVKRGVDCYIGEQYPFYIFNGESIFVVTRSGEQDLNSKKTK